MKAVIHETYGGPEVLKIVEVEKPALTDDTVLVRVLASSVNIAEWYAMTGLMLARLSGGRAKPKNPRLGVDFAGVVEAVGAGVTDFKPGDEVYGGRTGAYAEYVTVRNAIVPKPANATFEEAAAVPTAAVTALQALRTHGKLQSGQKVLINGASGGVGSFTVSIAKALGGEVTAVCSTRNVESARALGADHVVDYTRQDFTRGGQHYDLVIDVAGGRSWFAVRRVLKPEARVVLVGGPRTPLIGPVGHLLKMRLASLGSKRKLVFFIANFTREDLLFLKDLIETGQVRPFVEKVYPLEQVADAMRHLGEGHARGKIVVSLR